MKRALYIEITDQQLNELMAFKEANPDLIDSAFDFAAVKFKDKYLLSQHLLTDNRYANFIKAIKKTGWLKNLTIIAKDPNDLWPPLET